MVEQSFVPDFSEFYNQYELSDVNLFIQEEEHAAPCSSSSSSSSGSMSGDEEEEEACEPVAEQGPSKPRRKALPGHSMVLVAFSAFFKAKLKSWAAGPFNRPEIQLLVPAGQLELGELLLQAMYQCQPDLSSTSQLQLLQLLALADRYGVNKVLSAAVAALQAVPQAELQWETVIGVYTLPPGCTDACKPLVPAVQQQLQQQLGDLELALADSRQQQRLLALPHKVLLLLLQDEETKVAAENTVFRVIESWHAYQQQHGCSCSDKELTQLLQQLRMQHCTQPFVATVLSESPLAAKCFSPLELRLACICSSSTGGQPKAVAAAMEQVQCPALVRFPAWAQPKRPASAMTKLSMERQFSLADLQRNVEALQADGKAIYIQLVSGTWQGEEFDAQLCVAHAAQQAAAEAADGSKTAAAEAVTSSRPFKVGIYVGPKKRCKDMLRLISFSVAADAVTPPAPELERGGRRAAAALPQHITLRMTRQGFSSLSWGWADFFSYGSLDSWDAFEAKLRAGSLVHAGDCLHFKVEVTHVL